MSSSTPELTAAVITVSDSSSRGEREDLGGPAVAAALEKHKFRVVAREVVPDEQALIQDALVRLSGQTRFVVTTGGTGVAPRDVTPEATRAVCGRLIEGIAERMLPVKAEIRQAIGKSAGDTVTVRLKERVK